MMDPRAEHLTYSLKDNNSKATFFYSGSFSYGAYTSGCVESYKMANNYFESFWKKTVVIFEVLTGCFPPSSSACSLLSDSN